MGHDDRNLSILSNVTIKKDIYYIFITNVITVIVKIHACYAPT